MEGNWRFKIDWASLIVRSKFNVFALFHFVFEGNFPSTSPRGLIFGEAYTWRGLFSEFYGTLLALAIYRPELNWRLLTLSIGISHRTFA